MTKTEFWQEAKHLLKAFGITAKGSFDVETDGHKLSGLYMHEGKLMWNPQWLSEWVQDDPLQFEFRLEDENYRLQIQRKKEATASAPFSFTLQDRKTGRTTFLAHITPEQIEQTDVAKEETVLHWQHETPEQILHAEPKITQKPKSLLLYGLGKLGYDVVALCDKFNIPLSDQEKHDSTKKYQEHLKIPSIKAEFEREVRHILAAFGQTPQSPLEIKHKIEVQWYDTEFTTEGYEHVLQCSFTAPSFALSIGRSITIGDDTFHDKFSIRLLEPKKPDPTESTIAEFTQTQGEQFLYSSKESGECEPVLLRALATLGYDVVSLCERFHIDLSAHQRTELSLIYRQANSNP